MTVIGIEPLLDSSEAAAYLGVTYTTMRDWAHHKKGPRYVKIGRKRMYRRSDIIAWVDAQPHGGDLLATVVGPTA